MGDEIYLSIYNALSETMPSPHHATLNRRFVSAFTIRFIPITRTCRITHPTQISYDMWKIATFQITRPFSSKSGGSSGHGSPAVMWNSVTKAVEKYCADRTGISRIKTA
jgi:hypothetical protein